MARQRRVALCFHDFLKKPQSSMLGCIQCQAHFAHLPMIEKKPTRVNQDFAPEFSFIVSFLVYYNFPAIRSANVIQPPSGSVIYAPVNTSNVTTLRCDLFSPTDNTLQWIEWRLNQNQLTGNLNFLAYGEAPSFGRNLLTIINFASELDGQTLTCSGGMTGIAANFSLVVYRKSDCRGFEK